MKKPEGEAEAIREKRDRVRVRRGRARIQRDAMREKMRFSKGNKVFQLSIPANATTVRQSRSKVAGPSPTGRSQFRSPTLTQKEHTALVRTE